MLQLSAVLPHIDNGLQITAPTPPLSSMLAHFLTKNALTMTSAQIATASQPRETPITLDRAERALVWIRRLKSCRTRKLKWKETPCGWIETYRTSFNLPDDLTPQQVRNGLIDIVKPCSAMIVKELVKLEANKPFYGEDDERREIVFKTIIDSVKDMPEVAVVLAINDLCTSEGRFFPSNAEIIKEASDYKDTIYDALDYFKE